MEVLPNEAASHRRLAQYRTEKGQHAAAIEQWKQVIRVRTDEPDGWLQLATSQLAAGEKADAKETIRKILTKTWNDGGVHGKAEQLLKKAG